MAGGAGSAPCKHSWTRPLQPPEITTNNLSRYRINQMSAFLAKMAPKRAQRTKRTVTQNNEKPRHMQIMTTSYTSKPVQFSPSFLINTPYDAQPILTYPVDFAETPLPEYRGSLAVVLDNVLSASECKQLIAYAEESAGVAKVDKDAMEGVEENEVVENNGWKPALVNVGAGREVLRTDYRNSDRIIWDNQEIMNRLWARCLQGDGIEERFGRIEDNPLMQGARAVERGEKWHFSRLNERMRFLKYGPGQFFSGARSNDGFHLVYLQYRQNTATVHFQRQGGMMRSDRLSLCTFISTTLFKPLRQSISPRIHWLCHSLHPSQTPIPQCH